MGRSAKLKNVIVFKSIVSVIRSNALAAAAKVYLINYVAMCLPNKESNLMFLLPDLMLFLIQLEYLQTK